ncbi:MAG: DUF4914 family protein [Candidatus Sumerlaeia bacterium]
MCHDEMWDKMRIPEELRDIFNNCRSIAVANTHQELVDMCCGDLDCHSLEVNYELPDGTLSTEAHVARVRNGIVANYPDPYMRRRDPETMVIADDEPTDKIRFRDRFDQEFEPLRQETFEWLKGQDLIAFCFIAGRDYVGKYGMAVAPKNAAFFALGLSLLQGVLDTENLPDDFVPTGIIYVAPPFRHTHFDGKQVVVHNRRDQVYELFSYNLYPGPSAKKGVYGMLIDIGEKEGWVATHCSTVQVITPYDNMTTIMHEGASGGGKSEMLEPAHRLSDGRLLLGHNLVSNEKRYLEMPRSCDLRPVTDDMALCHPSIQQNDGRLWLMDAEDAWFVRVDHINQYGMDLDLEKLTANPPRPLLFLNIDAVPDSRALIWEHIEDEAGKPCPNPRVVIPRDIVPNIVKGPIGVDIRSMGVRMPPCTREKPSYGILGFVHVLPPALAWLWRLVSPRGFSNPSIVTKGSLSSEGVGSYWPFATGKMVNQANLLLKQIINTPKTRYILMPNQHVGAWKTGFMPQWVAREYLARRGNAPFQEGQIRPARLSILGYAVYSMRVEGTQIPHWMLEVQTQPEVGEDGYDAGAKILEDFFKETLEQYLSPYLSPLGRRIIECCMDGGKVNDYEEMIQFESRPTIQPTIY